MEDDSWLKHFLNLIPTFLFELNLICDGFYVDVETKFTEFTCSKSLSRNSLHVCLGSSQSRSKLV